MEKAADFFFPPVQSMFIAVKNKTADWFSSITSAKQYQAENAQLKETVAQLKREERETVSLRKENERLKQLLSLQNDVATHKAVACNVITEDAYGITGTFRIDKGKNHGIRKQDAVVSVDGLVGKVAAVYENSSTVTPITQAGNAVGARIVRNQLPGVAESRENRLLFSGFSEDTMPVVGDEVETSGTGGIYPAGILVGMVSAITKTGIEVEPAVRIQAIREVLVLCESR